MRFASGRLARPDSFCGSVEGMDVGAASRLAALRDRLRSEGADVIALTDVSNVAYCTDFEGVFDEEPAHVALVGAAQAILLTDSRYVEAMRHAAAGTEWQVRLATGALSSAVAEELAGAEGVRLALETTLPYDRYRALQEACLGEVVEARGWVEDLRVVKDEAELRAIAQAQELTDAAFDHVLSGVLRAGATEREVALELEFFMRREGSEGVAFAPIVASGPNSALPHAVPGRRELAAGDLVVLDFGARLGGYCADMTRTVVVGTASARQREVYGTVLEANRAATAEARADKTGRQVDAAARSVISAAGFGEYFGHGVGHGVGRQVHELPRVGPNSELPIPAGAVITIEPGIYIPAFGGVRIENLAVVERGGVRVLTRSDMDLLEL
jgi:Xaa-Pro aminopeptidase